jgi:hypothetical protein
MITRVHTVISSSLCLLLAAAPLPATAQSLRGSHASVVRMRQQAVRHNLTFYRTRAAVHRAVQRGRLVPLRPNQNYALHNVSLPYVTPSARTFIERLGAQYRERCDEPLVVTGAVRALSRQPRNASDQSVHPAGIAVDLRRPNDARCRAWLRRTLLSIEGEGAIEAIEEASPAHFHVAVFPNPYRRYLARLTPSDRSVRGQGLQRVDASGAPRG